MKEYLFEVLMGLPILYLWLMVFLYKQGGKRARTASTAMFVPFLLAALIGGVWLLINLDAIIRTVAR